MNLEILIKGLQSEVVKDGKNVIVYLQDDNGQNLLAEETTFDEIRETIERLTKKFENG